MPNFDGTGPAGQGARTGRRFGRCGNQNSKGRETDSEAGSTNYNEEDSRPGFGFRRRGFGNGSLYEEGKGRGRGRGHGMNRRFGRK